MFCPNCGRDNPDGVAFCSGCGMAFGTQFSQPAPQPSVTPVSQYGSAPDPFSEPPIVISQPKPAQNSAPGAAPYTAPGSASYTAPGASASGSQNGSSGQSSSSVSFGQHFKNLIRAASHPVTGPAEIVGQYDRIGDAIFLAGIVVVICWMAGFISSMSWDLVYNDWYSKLGLQIVKDFFFAMLCYSIRVFGCAGAFMLAGLIIKQKWSFPRLLAISAMAAPAFIVSDFLGSYALFIPYQGIRSLLEVAAFAYYFLMIFEGMGAETKLTGNKKGFVLVICTAVTLFVSYHFFRFGYTWF